MYIVLEPKDRVYFQEQLGREITDEQWKVFVGYVDTNLNNTLEDQLCDELDDYLNSLEQ